MKDLIIIALNNAFTLLEKQIPQTKPKLIEVNIDDVSPLNIVQFMKDNNIPDTAYFGGKDNGNDGFSEICLCYTVDIPTTDKDKLTYCKRRFTDIAWRKVYDLLLANGYKRVGYSTFFLKEFDDTTVYDMYLAKDFDRLVKYYSLPFKLIETI